MFLFYVLWMILLQVLAILYSLLAGLNDAVLWSKKGNVAFDWNEHHIFTVERFIFATALFGGVALGNMNGKDAYIDVVGIIAASAFMYPFFHNGMYYAARNRIDNTLYLKKWKDFTKHSSALINFTWKARLLFLYIGIVIFLFFVFRNKILLWLNLLHL